MAPDHSRYLQKPELGLRILARMIAREHTRRIRLNGDLQVSEPDCEPETPLDNNPSLEETRVYPES